MITYSLLQGGYVTSNDAHSKKAFSAGVTFTAPQGLPNKATIDAPPAHYGLFSGRQATHDITVRKHFLIHLSQSRRLKRSCWTEFSNFFKFPSCTMLVDGQIDVWDWDC